MSALDDMIEKHRLEMRQVKAANWLMHEQVLEEVAKRFACPVQMVHDVLYQVSIETDQKPVIVLEYVYQFLQTLATYQGKKAE